ncbi:hypothetical protein BU17DRAFT_72681 [Hysterangium stoloniferum]|nr:hypothetical protein BU17DRAFT_72681 [Hysterangium stoloniferum]
MSLAGGSVLVPEEDSSTRVSLAGGSVLVPEQDSSTRVFLAVEMCWSRIKAPARAWHCLVEMKCVGRERRQLDEGEVGWSKSIRAALRQLNEAPESAFLPVIHAGQDAPGTLATPLGVSSTYLDFGRTIPLPLRAAGAEIDAELDVEDDNNPAPPLNGDHPAFNTPLPSDDLHTDTDPTLLPLPTLAPPALGGLIADFNGPPDALLDVLVRTYGVVFVVVVMKDRVYGRDALATDAMEGVQDLVVVQVEPVDAVLERSIGLVIVGFGREAQRGRGRAVGVFAFAFVLGLGIDEDAAEAFDTTRDLPGVDDEECVLRNDAVDDVLLTDEIDVLLNDQMDPVLFSVSPLAFPLPPPPTTLALRSAGNGGSAFEGGCRRRKHPSRPRRRRQNANRRRAIRNGAEAEPDLARIEVFSCPFGAIVLPPPGPPVPTAPAPAPEPPPPSNFQDYSQATTPSTPQHSAIAQKACAS